MFFLVYIKAPLIFTPTASHGTAQHSRHSTPLQVTTPPNSTSLHFYTSPIHVSSIQQLSADAPSITTSHWVPKLNQCECPAHNAKKRTPLPPRPTYLPLPERRPPHRTVVQTKCCCFSNSRHTKTHIEVYSFSRHASVYNAALFENRPLPERLAQKSLLPHSLCRRPAAGCFASRHIDPHWAASLRGASRPNGKKQIPPSEITSGKTHGSR